MLTQEISDSYSSSNIYFVLYLPTYSYSQMYPVPLLRLLYQMSLSPDNFLFQIITKGCKNDRMGLVITHASCIYTCRKSFMKKKTETSKEKINAKIEDVGLNED